jgi:hypothetical protein
MSGSMRGMWKRRYGGATKAPPDERGGNRHARPTATAPHPDSTLLSYSDRGQRRTALGQSRQFENALSTSARPQRADLHDAGLLFRGTRRSVLSDAADWIAGSPRLHEGFSLPSRSRKPTPYFEFRDSARKGPLRLSAGRRIGGDIPTPLVRLPHGKVGRGISPGENGAVIGYSRDGESAGMLTRQNSDLPPQKTEPTPFAARAKDLGALRDAVVDAASVGAGLWISYLFALFYFAIAAGAVTHRDLLLESPVKLPFLNVELPLKAFFFLGPLVFLILHAYVLLHFVLMAGKIGAFHLELQAQISGPAFTPESFFEDARARLRRQLPSNIFVRSLAGPREVRRGITGFLLRRIIDISLVAGPIALWSCFKSSSPPTTTNGLRPGSASQS